MLRLNGIKSLTVEARSNVLQAAGYTTRRYVKLLHRSVEEPFPVSPARSSRRQEGVLLQGHPRPWPVAKPRTLWVPAHKVPGTNTGSAALTLTLAFSRGGTRVSCRLHALPLWTKKLSTSATLPWATPLSSLPCWVVPPPKTRQSAVPPASSLSSPLRGKPPSASCFNERPEAAAPSCRAFGRWHPTFDSALPRAVPARAPEAVCAHRLPVFAGGREPGVSRPLYRQSPSFPTR